MLSSWLHKTVRSMLLYSWTLIAILPFAALYGWLRFKEVGWPWSAIPIAVGIVAGVIVWEIANERIGAKVASAVLAPETDRTNSATART